MVAAAILFLLKARRRPLRTIEATEFKHIFPVGAGNGEAVVHSPPDSPARAAGYTKVHMSQIHQRENNIKDEVKRMSKVQFKCNLSKKLQSYLLYPVKKSVAWY